MYCTILFGFFHDGTPEALVWHRIPKGCVIPLRHLHYPPTGSDPCPPSCALARPRPLVSSSGQLSLDTFPPGCIMPHPVSGRTRH
jgi:hypothetical protein